MPHAIAVAATPAPLPPHSYTVVFNDHEGVEQTVEVVHPPDNPAITTLLGNALDIVEAAGKALAARSISLEAMGNDSAYLDALDRLAARFELVSLSKSGPTQRYLIEAMYGDDTGPWSDTVEAVDEEDAEFQAAWLMSESSGSSPSAPADFFAAMEDHNIHTVSPAPVTREELETAVVDLIRAHRAGESLAEHVATLSEMVEKLGYHLDHG